MDKQEFGQWLLDWMERKGLNYDDVIYRLGVGTGTIIQGALSDERKRFKADSKP